MTKPCPTVRTVVAALGGVSAVAKTFGVVEGAVHNWIARNRLPAYTVFEIGPQLEALGRSAPKHLWQSTRPAPVTARKLVSA